MWIRRESSIVSIIDGMTVEQSTLLMIQDEQQRRIKVSQQAYREFIVG